jgi:hypothetical protein
MGASWEVFVESICGKELVIVFENPMFWTDFFLVLGID